MLADRVAIAQASEEHDIDANRLPLVLKSVQEWTESLRAGSEAASTLAELVERVELSRDGIRVSLKLPLLPTDDRSSVDSRHLALTKFVPMQMKRRGVEMRMVLEGDSSLRRIDLPLLKAVARARKWSDDLISGRVPSVDEIAKREHLDRRSVRRLMPLAFLSPKVVEAIVEGRQPSDLSLMALTRRIDIPLLWSAQEQALGVR